ncbi:MAG: amidohydrolase [Candidatus Rokubacteria bacterium]|nr:amidohydrolase [Candidatus Rokubacteria bacterium]
MLRTVDLLLGGGTVITVDPQRRIYRDGAVAVKGSEIVAVGKRADLEKQFEARQVRDCEGKLVMPGLVNAHIHFYHTMHRGLAPEELDGWLWSNYVHGKIATVLTAEDEIYGGLVVLLEALKCGTTTFLEAGSYHPAAVIEGVSRIGMRGLMGRRSFDQAILDHAMLMEDTETCLRENEKFLKTCRDGYDGGRIKACVDIVGLGRCTNRLYVESKKMADEYGTVLNLHLAAMTEEVTDTRLRTGFRPVENLYRLGVLGPNVVLVHMTHVTDREIRMLAETRANVVHCPSTAVKLNYQLSSRGRFPEMLEHGVNVALGSDASDCSNYADMIRTMYLAAVLPKDYRNDTGVMCAETAIEMATINGARAIGMEREIGSLEPGKRADIIILAMRRPEWCPNYSPVQNLVYSASGDSVETAYVHGRLVMDERRVLTVDEGEVLDRCAALAERVLARSGVEVPSRWSIL